MIRKFLSAFLLISALAAVTFLTFQPREQTTALSNPVYEWFRARGFQGTEHELRSLAHIPEYFLLGCVLFIFGREWNIRTFFIYLAGALFGLADETVKIWLPFREFDAGDWCKDLIGLAAALLVISVLYNLSGKFSRKK